MPDQQSPRNLGLKLIACSVAGILLSLGLCGLGFYLSRDVHDGAPPTLDILGFFFFLASAFFLCVGIFIAIVDYLAARKLSGDQ